MCQMTCSRKMPLLVGWGWVKREAMKLKFKITEVLYLQEYVIGSGKRGREGRPVRLNSEKSEPFTLTSPSINVGTRKARTSKPNADS